MSPRIIGVVNQKGGVGKSTVTMGMAAVCAETSKVLVVDIDPQGSVTFWSDQAGDNLPFDTTSDLDPKNLSRLRELSYDVVFVDTPGSLENEHILNPVLDEADFLILPTEPAPLAVPPLLRTVKRLIEPRGVDYRVLINKYDPRTPQDADEAAELIDNAGLKRFQTSIRSYKIHTRAPIDGLVVTQYKSSRSDLKAAEDFRRVAMEMVSLWANASTNKGGR